MFIVVFIKQKTAYEVRISDCSSDVCSSDLNADLSVSNGTLSNVSSTDGGVTWTATFTPASNISDTSNLISLDTSGVVNVSGNNGVGVVNSKDRKASCRERVSQYV